MNSDDQEKLMKFEIAGVYSGIDNVGMESSIILRSVDRQHKVDISVTKQSYT